MGTVVVLADPMALLACDYTPEEMAAALIAIPGHQLGDCHPLRHLFAPGIYLRWEITMAAGLAILGAKHKTRHLNIISQGTVSFRSGGALVTVSAPYTFVSEPGVQKMLYIHETTVWSTIHPTDETDVAILEALLIEPREGV